MTVYIILTLAGSDTGPFDLYSDASGYTTAFETGISRATLVAGYFSSLAPVGTTTVLVRSTGVCQRDLYLPVAGSPTTTTTTTGAPITTTSTTTPAPETYTLAQVGQNARVDGCPLGTVLRIFLDSADYALFVANGYQFAGLGGGAETTCTAIARNQIGTPINGILYDEQGIAWKLTAGNFQYNDFQC